MPCQFETAHVFTAHWEGGLTDHPADPGGLTNYGVSLRWVQELALQARKNCLRLHKNCDSCPDAKTANCACSGIDLDMDGDVDADDIRACTREQAAILFKKHFWDAQGCAALPLPLAVVLYDGAVKMGPGRALAGAAAGTVGAVQQAEGRRQQTEYQAELAARNAQQAELSAQAADEAARQERRAGYEAAQAKRQEAARIIGAQRAQAGASGAQTDAGSTLDKNLDTVEKGELDALFAEQQGQSRAHAQDMRAWSLRNQSAEAASHADFAGSRAETDYLGLSSTLLNGASRVGRNFYTIGSRGPLLP